MATNPPIRERDIVSLLGDRKLCVQLSPVPLMGELKADSDRLNGIIHTRDPD